MELILGYIAPIAQIFLVIAVAVGVLVLAGIAKEYVRTKTNKDTTFAWNAIMNYVGVAVAAVAQIYKQKPEGMTDVDWDDVRFQKANDFVIDFAKTLGFTITGEFLNTIRGLIEGAVKSLKTPEMTSGTITPLLSYNTARGLYEDSNNDFRRDVEPPSVSF